MAIMAVAVAITFTAPSFAEEKKKDGGKADDMFGDEKKKDEKGK